MRPSNRAPNALRPVSLERKVARYAEGSCLVKFGGTHVLCTASLEDKPPPWLRGQGRGWITAEYAMLPRATHTRTRREVSSGKPSGRTHEIQRLIGRSLRAVTNLQGMGERQITIDCDVIQADGGTRTASITGAWIALRDCLDWMRSRSILKDSPLRDHVAAVSCGIYQGTPVLDLDYAEDSEAQTDANFVIAGSGALVEVQASAEGAVFSEAELASMMRWRRRASPSSSPCRSRRSLKAHQTTARRGCAKTIACGAPTSSRCFPRCFRVRSGSPSPARGLRAAAGSSTRTTSESTASAATAPWTTRPPAAAPAW